MKNTSPHDLYVSDDDGNPVVVKAGDDVPEGVEVPEEYTAEEPEVEYTDQVRDELIKTARSNLIPLEDDWTTDQVAQAIRLHNHAVATGGSVDWSTFPDSADVEGSGPTTTAGTGEGTHDVAALSTEYEQLTGEKPDGRWRPATLARKVEEARESGSGGAG